ncbi:MAG: Holliday junction resolvase RuvX [Tissierellia bacterium]|nr:Holliday junction resolvase RuvX [Tissierellia bacterium]
MERVMGLDIGDKTIGIAISDPLLITAQGLETIARKNLREDMDRIDDIIEDYNITKMIVGLPKNMNNTIGPQGEKVLNFVDKLRDRFDIMVVLEDERLTTKAAERMLIEGDVSRRGRRRVIDKVAATYILQTYLDRIGR